MNYKEYLGDGVYADFDGFDIELTTDDGISVDNRIVIEPEVAVSLLRYLKRISDLRSTK